MVETIPLRRAVDLPPMHRLQIEVAQNPARFKVLAAGARWGKTRLASAICFETAISGGRAWWIAPTFGIAQIGWDALKGMARQCPWAEIHEARMEVIVDGRGSVQCKSSDNPDSLRGRGLDLALFEEAAFQAESAWNEAIRPRLSDRLGKAMFISTPKGRNWFWRLYEGAIGDGWARWCFPTSSNPYIKPSEIEEARRKMPERIFRQEYLAEFILDGAGVFRRVDAAATATRQDKAEPKHSYAFGVDWGKSNDFTVIAVLDLNLRAIVAVDRFNQIDYTLQRERLRALYERFNPVVIVAESNSMGEPIIEQLQREGLPVDPFLTSNATKGAAIEAVALALERGDMKIVNDETLTGELKAYESERLPSGLTRYSAPEGMHDDCVMALALAWTQAGPEGRRITGII